MYVGNKHTANEADNPIVSTRSLPRTEKNMFRRHVIVIELVGGTIESEKRGSATGKPLTARRSEIARIERLYNNYIFFPPDPKFHQSGWIIHF